MQICKFAVTTIHMNVYYELWGFEAFLCQLTFSYSLCFKLFCVINKNIIMKNFKSNFYVSTKFVML